MHKDFDRPPADLDDLQKTLWEIQTGVEALVSSLDDIKESLGSPHPIKDSMASIQQEVRSGLMVLFIALLAHVVHHW